MKKLALLLFTCVLTVVSCKKGSNDPTDLVTPPQEPKIEMPPGAESGTLPMKVLLSTNGTSVAYNITYQQGTKKIDKITSSNGNVDTYHYKGNLIDKIEYGTGGAYSNYEYDNDALIRVTHYISSGQSVGKTEYTYPSNTKVTFVESRYENNTWEADEPVSLEFDGKGNVVKGASGGLLATVTYDDKNSPFVNVAGWSKIHFTGGIPLGDNVDIADIVGRRNNPTATKVTGTASLDLGFSYEFEDANNSKFPTKITGTQSSSTAFTAEICYSTNCNIPGNPNVGEQPNPETSTLPSTIVMTGADGQTHTYTITYLGNSAKIDKITETGGKVETYLYSGNLISEKHDGTDESTSENYDLYEYDVSNRLTKELAYRQNKTQPGITELSYSGAKTFVTGDGMDNGKIELGYDSKGNLTNLTLLEGSASAAQLSITYDDKNAPFRNVPGWGKIRYLVAVPLGDNIGFEDILTVVNNPLKVTGNIESENVELTYNHEFTDSKNPTFPTKIVGVKKEGTKSPITFTVEITYTSL